MSDNVIEWVLFLVWCVASYLMYPTVCSWGLDGANAMLASMAAGFGVVVVFVSFVLASVIGGAVWDGWWGR